MMTKIKNSKITLIIAGVCLLFTICFVGFKIVSNTYASPDDNYLVNQTVDGLSFENASLISENGISKYIVNVVNDNKDDYSLKTINVTFKDNEGNEITTLLGYIGDSLSPNEEKVLNISTDQEITGISSIEYKINK